MRVKEYNVTSDIPFQVKGWSYADAIWEAIERCRACNLELLDIEFSREL